MNDQVFQLLQTQHTEVMSELKNIRTWQEDHTKEDQVVHKMVERHTLYFNVALLGIPVLLGAIAKKMGFEL